MTESPRELPVPESESLPATHPYLLAEPLGDGLLVWDPHRRLVHHLDPVGSLVFKLADGKTPVLEAEELLLPFAGSAKAARALLQATLALLGEVNLLVEREAPCAGDAAVPASFWQSNRRAFLGGAGKIAFSLPVLGSLFLPGAAAAFSGVGGIPPVLETTPGGDRYSFREDQPFRLTRMHPSATFAADVDSASYANVRRFLKTGQLPPADAVRIEEFLNAFHYDDPEPRGSEPLALAAELSACPWQPRHLLLRLGLQSPRLDVESLPPRRLVFLLDTSGSMQGPDRLPLVRQAMRLLAETLRPADQVAIVGYAGNAGVLLAPTPGDRIATILAAIDELEAAGSTAGSKGIELAYELAAEMAAPGCAPRVLLATDGDFNVGITDQGQLIRMIEQQRERGIYLSVLGFGRGNLNDATMELLADRGNGNYSYIDSLDEARRVLVSEGGATLSCVARDLKLQLEWNGAEVAAWRLLGYENRMLAAEDFTNDKKDGGEIGAGHHVTALFELIPPGVELPESLEEAAEVRSRYGENVVKPVDHVGEIGIVRLRFKVPEGGESRTLDKPLNRFVIESSELQTSDDFRLAAGLAVFAMVLRGSPDRGRANLAQALQLVTSAFASDWGGQRAELLQLIAMAVELSRRQEL